MKDAFKKAVHFTTLCLAPSERQERQSSPPRRAGRYRGGGDNDEFLRMLGITPDEPSKQQQAETTEVGK